MDSRSSTITLTLDFKGRELGSWTVDRPLTIGRSADNDIVIDNLSISRRHAVIEPTDDGCVLRDAGSLNGIQVNGVRTQETPLKHGDVVTLGKHRITCHIPTSGEAGPVDPEMFDPTVYAQPDELKGTIADAGWLVEVTADGEVRHALDRPLILIGSDEAADIILSGKSIAPYHAEIKYQDGVYRLRHLEGRRAVTVDGNKVEECVLTDGCSIAIGDWTCAFHAPVPTTTTG